MEDRRPQRRHQQDESALGPIEVPVIDNNVNRALNSLKREIGREGINAEVKRRRYYEKPSVAKRRKTREAERQRRKDARRQTTRTI
jgi:small subunit ribosomal protein S21